MFPDLEDNFSITSAFSIVEPFDMGFEVRTEISMLTNIDGTPKMAAYFDVPGAHECNEDYSDVKDGDGGNAHFRDGGISIVSIIPIRTSDLRGWGY